MAAWAQIQRGDHPIRADMDWSSESGEFTARGAARTIIRSFPSAGLHTCAVAEPDVTRCTTKAVGAVFATAVSGGAAGAAIRYTRWAAHPVNAVFATALSVLLTLLPVALTARRGGSSLTDAQRCQRAPYEGCSHQPKRPPARDATASQSSSQLVEGAVGSLLAHLCPLSPKGGTRGLAPPR
jgi:hypothetical protein